MPTGSLLPESWNVPQTFRSRLGDAAGRQRAMFADGHLLLILHRPPKADETEREGRFFWRRPDGTWQSPHALGGSVEILRQHVREYLDAAEDLEEDEERAQSAAEYFRILTAVAPLRRASRHLHETLQAAREKVPDDRDLIGCRDQAGSVERATELLEGEVKNGLDYVMARRAEEEARNSYAMALSSHKLNVLAATFFPIVTVSSIFGMNLTHGLENTPMWLFWAVLVLGIASGGLLHKLVVSQPLKGETESDRRLRRARY